MKNALSLILTLSILMTVGLGCGIVKRVSGNSEPAPSNSNKTVTDKAVDITVGDEKTGIPECDEVVELFRQAADNPDDGYVTKAIKATVLNKIKESFRKSLEENKTDKVEMAKQCRDFKLQLEKYKAEEESKQK